MRLGYNTNGLPHHRLPEALELLAGIGYQAVAVTPDVSGLDPYALRPGEVEGVRARAEDLGLWLAVETGARFLLDPARKHRPNLMDLVEGDRARRVDFYRRCVDLAVGLGAPLISLWSGATEDGLPFSEVSDAARRTALGRLAEGLVEVLDHATACGVRVAFEPEPGMFIERVDEYRALTAALGERGPELGLTIDVGHLVVNHEPLRATIEGAADALLHVHLDDARAGVHEHLMFGRGELDLDEVGAALGAIGYDGMAAVELSRDGHRGADAASEAWGALGGFPPARTGG